MREGPQLAINLAGIVNTGLLRQGQIIVGLVIVGNLAGREFFVE
jgi:hypothetical protein